MHSAGSVDGFDFGAGVGFDVDGGVDGDGGVYAEDWTEPEGYAGGKDCCPAVARVVLGGDAEGGIETWGEGDNPAGASVICRSGGGSAAHYVIGRPSDYGLCVRRGGERNERES